MPGPSLECVVLLVLSRLAGALRSAMVGSDHKLQADLPFLSPRLMTPALDDVVKPSCVTPLRKMESIALTTL